MNQQINDLITRKRELIEANTEFIIQLFEFMLLQPKKPVHPVYSANRFRNFYESGYLKITLFERSVQRKPRFASNRYFSIRVQRDHDNPDYPLCWLEIEHLTHFHDDEPDETNIMIEVALENEFQVFVPEGEDGWVQHMKKIIGNQKERKVNREKENEQKQIDHYKKLLRL